MKMKFAALVTILLFVSHLKAQDKHAVIIDFKAFFNHTKLNFKNEYLTLNKIDSINFSSIKFYISNVELCIKNKAVYKEENSFHLIDLSFDSTSKILLHVPTNLTYDQLKFNIGIDSLTNVSGALGGDLDPTKGMYWTWQNGYINIKVEGNSNLCTTRHNEFQFHIGGYSNPFNSLQTKIFSVSGSQEINIGLELDKMIREINLETQNKIMSPSKESLRIGFLFANIFIIGE